MLILTIERPIYFCLKHPENETARSDASVALVDERLWIRDAVTMKYGYKNAEPVYDEFTVYLSDGSEVYCKHLQDTCNLSIDAPHHVQPMTEGNMINSNFAPPYTR